MSRQQTVWPVWSSYGYMASECAGVLVPSSRVPFFYNMVFENPNPKEHRRFSLDRSVFDLVDAHKYLALTDPKLLSWYLCLTPEDRKIIQDEGGFHQFLQRHPALELSQHHVYVKYNIAHVIPGLPTMTSNRPTHVSRSNTPGATTCRSDVPCTHLDSEMLSNVRETLTMLGCSGEGSQKHPHEELCSTKQLVHLQDGYQTAFSSPTTQEPTQQRAHTMRGSSHLYEQSPSWPTSSSSSVYKDPAALANFALDMDLERSRQWGKPEIRSQMARPQGQSANLTYAEGSPLQSEWPTIEKDSSPECYSLNSIQMDVAEYNDGSIIQSAQPDQASSPQEESNTKEGCEDHMLYGNEYTADNESSLSFEDDNYHSIMENDKSILACLTSEDMKAHNNGLHSGPVSTDSEALAASRDTLKSVIKMNIAESYISPTARVTTCDIMVGTELPPRTSAVTQTEDPETADKHVITEVHMADLDYLAEEFHKMAQEEKEKKKSYGCKLRKECDCIQRAERAELCLLALQYSMCRQHCSTLYYTSATGGRLAPMSNNPPANIVSVLQKLESDYNQLRDKILAGVPLEQLQPLSVDSEKITKGTSYIPAQIIGDVLGNVPSCSQEPQKHNSSSGEANKCHDDQSRSGRQEKQMKKDNCKARRALTLVPQDRDAIHNAHKPEEKQTTACKELNTSEAWYDAEEDLQPAGPAETGQDPTVIAKDETNESASEEVQSSVLCVSNLPTNVSECDVMLWFEKYHASEVSISALKNVRVAIVMISGPQSAEAAARELNGRSMQGHTLHVEHINRASGGSQSQALAAVSGPESAKPQTSKTDSSSTERMPMSQPPLSSLLKNRKVVCISPTAKGTCVPQHYGTMGSFDTLMTELTQRHPDVARQRIVDALIELKAKHQGVLSGLPLRTIREMTSELLTRPASATPL